MEIGKCKEENNFVIDSINANKKPKVMARVVGWWLWCPNGLVLVAVGKVDYGC